MKATPSQKKKIYGLIRQIIVLRDKEKCLRCGKVSSLQMSHIYPKGSHRKMEFDEENIKFLCLSCHLYWWHKSPIEAWEWLNSILEPARLRRLKMRAGTVDKTPFDYNATKLYLEQKIRDLKK